MKPTLQIAGMRSDPNQPGEGQGDVLLPEVSSFACRRSWWRNRDYLVWFSSRTPLPLLGFHHKTMGLEAVLHGGATGSPLQR